MLIVRVILPCGKNGCVKKENSMNSVAEEYSVVGCQLFEIFDKLR